MVRLLPSVITSIKDLSALPEGARSLTVGIVLQSKKGAIGEAKLQTSPTDLLTNYTFSGTVKPNDDKSFFTALNILRECNQLYVIRSAKNALYGGLVVKKEDLIGNVFSITSSTKTIELEGDKSSSISTGIILRLSGISTVLDTRYTVASVSYNETSGKTEVIVTETITSNYTYTTGTKPLAYLTRQPVPLSSEKIGDIIEYVTANRQVKLSGNLTDYLLAGDKVQIKNSGFNNNIFTVVSALYDIEESETTVTFEEQLSPETGEIVVGSIYRNSIAIPENYKFKTDDLFLVTGTDQGAYNSNIEIGIISYKESPEDLSEAGTFEIMVYDALTNTQLESTYTVSREETAKAIDGTALYIEGVMANSAYVKVVDNKNVDASELPCDTVQSVQMSGGYDGVELTDNDLVGALEPFADKTIPVSILANGSIETPNYQQALIALANSRTDCFAFINSRLTDELASTNSQRAENIKNYKKNVLSSTSFYSAMYAPHVNVPDVFNSRDVKVGADAKIIPGWLNIVRTQGYPFVYAGTKYGKVQGCTTDWKIGNKSGEGVVLNDASVNFIAFNPKQGEYVAWTQNTLQIANSALRNIGAVLNLLDMKEALTEYLEEYLQLPITTELREEIDDKVTNYMDILQASNRVTNYVYQDISTDTDISNNTLKLVITISLPYYAQNIYLALNIVDQTFDFSILQNV